MADELLMPDSLAPELIMPDILAPAAVLNVDNMAANAVNLIFIILKTNFDL
jgi:hypothetical protein